MIQRIQTIYMIIAIVLSVACLCMEIGTFSIDGLTIAHEYNLWVMTVDNNAATHQFTTAPMFAVLILSATLGIYSIFAYRNRIAQAKLCMFNMLLLLGWNILYAVYRHILIDGNGQPVDFDMCLPAFFPVIALIFYLLARRRILADENLVRAADRIR